MMHVFMAPNLGPVRKDVNVKDILFIRPNVLGAGVCRIFGFCVFAMAEYQYPRLTVGN